MCPSVDELTIITTVQTICMFKYCSAILVAPILRANFSNLRMAQKCYAAEKNKQHILNVLEGRIDSVRVGSDPVKILEVASGTGEHAALFAESLLNVHYQPTEPQVAMHESIVSWTSTLKPGVVNKPVALDVINDGFELVLPDSFKSNNVDIMICINMIHISPIECTNRLFKMASKCLKKTGFLLTYGPYRVNQYMTDSNIAFDESLKSRNPEWGVRDLEDVEARAALFNMRLVETISMPANNLCVVFKLNDV